MLTRCNSLSTLSQKSETVSQKWDCRRKVQLLPNSATVAVFCDSLTFVRQCGQGLKMLSRIDGHADAWKYTEIMYFARNERFAFFVQIMYCRLYTLQRWSFICLLAGLNSRLNLWKPRPRPRVNGSSLRLRPNDLRIRQKLDQQYKLN